MYIQPWLLSNTGRIYVSLVTKGLRLIIPTLLAISFHKRQLTNFSSQYW